MRSYRFFWCVFIIIFGYYCSALKADPSFTPSPLSILRAGDSIHIKVLNNRGIAEIDQDFLINDRGEIDLPIIGLFKVSGFRAPNLAQPLSKILSEKAFKSPRIQANPVKLLLSDKLFIFGGVKNPGVVDFRDSISIMDAINLCGGFEDPTLSEAPFLRVANFVDSRTNQPVPKISDSFDYLENTKLKRGGKEYPINLRKLIREGDISQNVLLANDDVLMIPTISNGGQKLRNNIYILGAVNNPCCFRIRKNLTVLEAISSAGGLSNPDKLFQITIIRDFKPEIPLKNRKPEIIQIDKRQLFSRGKLHGEQILKVSDILLVSNKELFSTSLQSSNKKHKSNLRMKNVKKADLASEYDQLLENLLPIMNRMDKIIEYDEDIRQFNDRFLK